MGYYTYYTLGIENLTELPEGKYEEIHKYLKDHSDTFYALDGLDGPRDTAKWYDHDGDMLELSLEFPGVVFRLEGEGEECGDLWKTYYRDGLFQNCSAIITFDPYDELKLRKPRMIT